MSSSSSSSNNLNSRDSELIDVYRYLIVDEHISQSNLREQFGSRMNDPQFQPYLSWIETSEKRMKYDYELQKKRIMDEEKLDSLTERITDRIPMSEFFPSVYVTLDLKDIYSGRFEIEQPEYTAPCRECLIEDPQDRPTSMCTLCQGSGVVSFFHERFVNLPKGYCLSKMILPGKLRIGNSTSLKNIWIDLRFKLHPHPYYEIDPVSYGLILKKPIVVKKADIGTFVVRSIPHPFDEQKEIQFASPEKIILLNTGIFRDTFINVLPNSGFFKYKDGEKRQPIIVKFLIDQTEIIEIPRPSGNNSLSPDIVTAQDPFVASLERLHSIL